VVLLDIEVMIWI